MHDRQQNPVASAPTKKYRATDSTAFFTPRQLAARWAFHPESVRRLLRKGQIESRIISRRRLIPLFEIERIEAAGRVGRAA